MKLYDIFVQANAEWEKGNNEIAFELFLKAATLGESAAQHNIGYFYEVGEGVAKDINKALYWYKKAWRADGQTDTCMNIAQLYASAGNSKRAVFWWSKAVSKNDGDAALELAKFYLSRNKRGDKNKAFSLLTRIKQFEYISESGAEEANALMKKIE